MGGIANAERSATSGGGLLGVGEPGRQPGRLARALLEIEGILVLTALTLRALFARPITWPRDFLDQSWILIQRCTIPLAISTFAFGFGAPGIQGGNINEALGTIDRLGVNFVTSSVREFSPWITGMVLAGVGGTAVCADLGARKIREELDAMRVIGVDPVRTLVLPRFLALGVVTSLMNLVGVAFAALAGVLVTTAVFHAPSAGFVATFTNNFALPELYGSVLKTSSFGFIIAIVCCYKGMTARGGPEGVGRAVNQAVVISFTAIWIFNYAFTSVLLSSYPELQGLR